MADELCFRSATELALDIRRGTLSPVDVVDAFLDRIDARNDAINAYVDVFDERARAAARDAERAVERGDRLGPLHGIPVALKDLEDVAGRPTTAGSKPLADAVADADGIVANRLADAGAIILGKTNTPEYGHKGATDNLLFGPTSTPFDPAKNAGGSSGGSAAAVADGLAPIAQGSDGGGSVRIPSAWCGIFGFKATFRRIARPATPNAFTHTPYTQLGPHARTVEDAALLMTALHGPDAADPLSLPDTDVDYLGATRQSIDGFRVAYSPTLGGFPVDERVRAVVDDAVDAFEAAGATVEEVEPDFGHPHDELTDWWLQAAGVNYAVVADTVRTKHGVDYTGADRDDTTPEFVDLIERGRDTSAKAYKAGDIVRTDVFLAIQRLFETYDLLVSPTLAALPVDNAADGNTVGPSTVDGEPVNPLLGWCLTFPFNMSGHPAASVPAGLADGLPVGLQIAGPRFDDEAVLAASAAFERVRPWRETYPPR